MILDEVKAALRIKGDLFDTVEIEPLIEACKTDLRLAGANKILDSDPLTVRAIVFYCKANFGYAEDSEKWRAAYEHLKCALALAGTIDEDGP